MAFAKTLIMFAVAFAFVLLSEGSLLLKDIDDEETPLWMPFESCEVPSYPENLLMFQRFVTKSDSTGSKESCESWCQYVAERWEAKCMWKPCKGCSDCSDVCPLWCTDATLSWAACEPCTATPTASPTTSSPTPSPTPSPTAEKTCSTESGDVSGDRLPVGGKILDSSAAECKSTCEETADCACYAFDPSRSNTCWLKSSPCGEQYTWEESDDMTYGTCSE